jgi:hypothetical protein
VAYSLPHNKAQRDKLHIKYTQKHLKPFREYEILTRIIHAFSCFLTVLLGGRAFPKL